MNLLLTERRFGAQKFLNTPKCTGGGSGCTRVTTITKRETKWDLEATEIPCSPRANINSRPSHRAVGSSHPINQTTRAGAGVVTHHTQTVQKVFSETSCTPSAEMTGGSTATVSSITMGTTCTCRCTTNCGPPVLANQPKPPFPLPTVEAGPTITYTQQGVWKVTLVSTDRTVRYPNGSRVTETDPITFGPPIPDETAAPLTKQVPTKKFVKSRIFTNTSTIICTCGAGAS